MGRRRTKQIQSSRIYYKEHDHRDIIMNDNYHGALYMDDQLEPVWRRYRHRLVLVNTGLKESGDFGQRFFVAIDPDNLFFSLMQFRVHVTPYVGNPFDWDMSYEPNSNLSYSNELISVAGGFIGTFMGEIEPDGDDIPFYLFSKNGYDWKGYKYADWDANPFNTPSGIYGKNQYLLGRMYRSDNQFDLHQWDYNEDEKNAGDPEYVGRISCPSSTIINSLSTDQYDGCFYSLTTSQRIGGTYRYTRELYIFSGIPGESVGRIFYFTYQQNQASGLEMPSFPPRRIYHMNGKFFYFIDYSTSSGTTIQRRHVIMTSDTASPGDWEETEIISPYYTRINGQYQDTPVFSWNGDDSVLLYRNNKYYVYVRGDNSFRSESRQYLFISDDLYNWSMNELPDYIDIPYFNADFSNRKYGAIKQSPYKAIRYRFSTATSPLPSNVIMADSNLGFFQGAAAFTQTRFYEGMNYFEIVDGKPTREIEFDDVWIAENTAPNTIVCINCDFYTNNNKSYAYYIDPTWRNENHVEPISEDDYIFNS